MFSLDMTLADESATRSLGLRIGRHCQLPLVIGLSGDLGAGKTTLSQAIGAGFGVTEPMPSPTFTLINEYHTPRGRLYHLDLYRLDDYQELIELGFEELLLRPDVLVLVEWIDRFAEWPSQPPRLQIRLEHAPPGRRLWAALPPACPGLAACFNP